MRCSATTKSGARCKRFALAGGELCHAHSGERVGRPSVLTPEVCDRIVQAVKAGAPNRIAALAAGISETTLYELLKRGRAEQSGPCRELYEAVERARGEAYLHAMASWRRDMAAPGNWRAAVAYIDRVDRGRFASEDSAAGSSGGRPTGAGSSPRRLDLSQLSEEVLAYLEDLSARAEEPAEGEVR